jgi:SepF-like predicted cell division protein (DUF552 family)
MLKKYTVNDKSVHGASDLTSIKSYIKSNNLVVIESTLHYDLEKFTAIIDFFCMSYKDAEKRRRAK